MEQVRIDLTNCYGIKALTATFDFWPLRCRVFSSMDCSCCLLFGLDSIDFGFETVACIGDYASACRNQEIMICSVCGFRPGREFLLRTLNLPKLEIEMDSPCCR